MSNFYRNTHHPRTRKTVIAYWMDDHFGPRQYGIAFRKDGKDYDADTTDLNKDVDIFREHELPQ